MLLELLPHFARLMPMADKYLTSRSMSDKAQQEALAALAGEVRGELAQVTEAHSSMRRQLAQQTAQVAELGVDVTRARMGVESIEARIGKLEKQAAASVKLLAAAVLLLVIAFALLMILVWRVVH